MELKIIKDNQTIFSEDITVLTPEKEEELKQFNDENCQSMLINFKPNTKVSHTHNLSQMMDLVQELIVTIG